jgi:hypothetical protein
MRGKRLLAKPGLVCGIFGLLAAGLTAARADDAACRGLADAMIKNSKTPYHSVGDIAFDPKDPTPPGTTIAAKPLATETIFTGTQVFVKLPNGQWKDIHAVISDLQGHVQASAASFNDCKQLPNDTIDGKTYSVYWGEDKTDTVTVETQVWISADTGTLAHTKTEIAGPTAPDGKIRHQLITLTYDYAGIKAPAVSN